MPGHPTPAPAVGLPHCPQRSPLSCAESTWGREHTEGWKPDPNTGVGRNGAGPLGRVWGPEPRAHLVPSEGWVMERRCRAGWDGSYLGRTETAEEQGTGEPHHCHGTVPHLGGDSWGPPSVGWRCRSPCNVDLGLALSSWPGQSRAFQQVTAQHLQNLSAEHPSPPSLPW